MIAHHRPTPLYYPEVHGVGTFLTPSVSSLIVRAAADHGIGPRVLVRRVLGGIDPRIRSLAYGAFFARYGFTMNGSGKYAEMFVAAMTAATGRADLDRTTLLPWTGFLPRQGSAVIARHRRWCAECWADMRSAGHEPYDYLLWALALAEECPIHKIALESRCSCCGKLQPALPQAALVTRCDHCRAPLTSGQSSAASPPPGPTLTVLADLLANTPAVDAGRMLARWRAFLQRAADDLADGKRAPLARLIGLPSAAFKNWFTKAERPSLAQMVQVCTALGTVPSAIFVAEDSSEQTSTRAVTRAKKAVVGRAKGKGRGEPPKPTIVPPIVVVASDLEMTRAKLKRLDETAYRALQSARRVFRETEQREIRQLQEAYVRRTVDRMARSREAFGRKRVEASLRAAGFSLLNHWAEKAYWEALQQIASGRQRPGLPPALNETDGGDLAADANGVESPHAVRAARG